MRNMSSAVCDVIVSMQRVERGEMSSDDWLGEEEAMEEATKPL